MSGSVPRAQPSRGLAGYFAMITRRQQKPELRKAVLRQGHTCVAVLLANYLLCSSGQLNSGWSGLFVLCFGIRVALRNQNRDHRKAQRVFSWLDKDGDHICADHGAAGRAVVFHQSCRTSFYRKHADALRHGISGPLGYRIVKVSLSRLRSAQFWWSRARTRGCARVESAKIRKPLIRRG